VRIMKTSCARRAACLFAAAVAAVGVGIGIGVGSLAARAAAPAYAPVTADQSLVFPSDHGSHPQFRTEWWYVTGWLTTEHGEPLGFQITFFRSKPDIDESNPSAFTPHQLLIAHCALSDPNRGRLWQDQRIRRAGLGLAEAAAGDTHVWIDSWSLQRVESGYTSKIDAENFSINLTLRETQAVLLNGDAGVSRKGPSPTAASHYYSLPHLRVAGAITRQGAADGVTGEAWLDHEWSSEYLDSQAVGWDWIGINLDEQTVDWGTVVERRTSKEPIEKGGWSLFPAGYPAAEYRDPIFASNVRGNGQDAWFGWPSDAELERMRATWMDSVDPAERRFHLRDGGVRIDPDVAVLREAFHVEADDVDGARLGVVDEAGRLVLRCAGPARRLDYGPDVVRLRRRQLCQ